MGDDDAPQGSDTLGEPRIQSDDVPADREKEPNRRSAASRPTQAAASRPAEAAPSRANREQAQTKMEGERRWPQKVLAIVTTLVLTAAGIAFVLFRSSPPSPSNSHRQEEYFEL